jgi:PAS domain S-box-containing protein
MPPAFQDGALPVGAAAPGGREQAADVVQTTLLGDGVDNVELGIFVYDDDGKYVAVNRQAAELLGYPRAELLTRHVADFTEGGIDRRVLLRHERREGVRVVRRKDGSEVTVAYVVAPTRIGSIGYCLGVVWPLAPEDPRAVGAR